MQNLKALLIKILIFSLETPSRYLCTVAMKVHD